MILRTHLNEKMSHQLIDSINSAKDTQDNHKENCSYPNYTEILENQNLKNLKRSWRGMTYILGQRLNGIINHSITQSKKGRKKNPKIKNK